MQMQKNKYLLFKCKRLNGKRAASYVGHQTMDASIENYNKIAFVICIIIIITEI